MDQMTDAELIEWLHLTPGEAAAFLPKLSAEKRALYDHMREVEIEATLWVNGLGPKPTDVLIDTEHSIRHRKVWR